MSNPLLQLFQTPYQVPPFGEIKHAHFIPAIDAGIEEARKEIQDIAESAEPATFENTVEALEWSGEKLSRVAPIIFNLNAAETNEELQKITQEASQKLTAFNNDIKQNEKLFGRIKAVYNQRDQLQLTGEQRMLLEKTFKSFVRSGAELKEQARERFREISMSLSKLGLEFGENLLAETNQYELVIDREQDLSGLPKDVVNRASHLAKEKGYTGKWVFTLQAPSFMPFMEHADNRQLREKMYKAHMSKCFKGDDRDNQKIIQEIVSLRAEMAALLGYSSFAEFVLEERMAESPENVVQFLDELLEKARPLAEKEVEEIKDYMRQQGVDHDLQRWDWAYYSEKLRKEKYNLDDEQLKPYFKLENVIEGVFKTARKLYKISFQENKEIPRYHKDVTVYEVLDEKNEVIAIFFADFFPRAGKRGGAWMTAYRDQAVKHGSRVIPQVSIVCNFTPSTSDSPSLLKFDEVKTLFHEFGHALHGMLADATYASLSGTSVYWDFVELPSQIMENWCFEKECLDLFARHFETGEAIPQSYLDSLKKASTYHEAYATIRQVSFAMLDMAYHTGKGEVQDVGAFERKAMASTELFPAVAGTNMSVQFGHIFAGGYAAGYYSYKWAEVLDADAFELFKEKGVFDEQVAISFRDIVLQKGGTEHPMTLYKKFRGREPDINALLRRAGLA